MTQHDLHNELQDRLGEADGVFARAHRAAWIGGRTDAPGIRAALALLCLAVCGATLACGESTDGPSRTAVKAATAPLSPAVSERKPNLVLITLDTTRADALGTYGQTLATSPNIDRLAAAGVIFEQAVTSSPETLPSHATIFTGLQPYAHGVRANAGYVLSDRNVTLAEVFSDHGYRTGAEIAAQVLGEATKIGQGFAEKRNANSPGVELMTITFSRGGPDEKQVTKQIRVGADITRRGIEFIRRHRDRPFFLWLHYFDPHSPYKAPARFNQAIPESPYHAEVASADHEVGRVISAIEELGLRERTLVVLTADHGEGLNDHGEATHSFFVYDSTMRVPLIFWGLDGTIVSRRVESLARTVDIAPTVLDLLGLPGLPDAQGVSLRPQLTGREGPARLAYGESSMAFLGVFGIPPLRFVREGQWKYIHKVEPELYDVIADPGETTNRIADAPEVAERLRARLEALIREAPEAPEDAVAPVGSETAAQLAALGYVTSGQAAAADRESTLLELSGDDPVSKARDVELLAVTAGLVQRQAYAKALADLHALAERNPNSRFMQALLVEALLGLGRSDEAIPPLRRIRELGVATSNETAQLANLLAGQGERDEAIGLLREVLQREPCHEGALSDLNLALRAEARFPELTAALEQGARDCPDLASNLNNYAWALATLPRDDLRDGAKAVEFARAALAARGDRDPGTLDTLAAALAETGDFDQAVRVQSGVLQRLQATAAPEAVVAAISEHLEAFRNGRPIRDPEPPVTP